MAFPEKLQFSLVDAGVVPANVEMRIWVARTVPVKNFAAVN